jgi:hypothetical protein
LSEWRQDFQGESFKLIRSELWDSSLKRKEPATTSQIEPKSEDERPPIHHGKNEQLKHGDRQIVSLIDIPLWSEAKWTATAYGYGETQHFPYLAIGFRNEAPAKAIFKGLRNRLGEIDSKELLRVSAITGINRKDRLTMS